MEDSCAACQYCSSARIHVLALILLLKRTSKDVCRLNDLSDDVLWKELLYVGLWDIMKGAKAPCWSVALVNRRMRCLIAHQFFLGNSSWRDIWNTWGWRQWVEEGSMFSWVSSSAMAVLCLPGSNFRAFGSSLTIRQYSPCNLAGRGAHVQKK